MTDDLDTAVANCKKGFLSMVKTLVWLHEKSWEARGKDLAKLQPLRLAAIQMIFDLESVAGQCAKCGYVASVHYKHDINEPYLPPKCDEFAPKHGWQATCGMYLKVRQDYKDQLREIEALR